MNEDRLEAIRQRLSDALQPTSLEVLDESHLHVGHEGAKDGKGHFRIRIAALAFSGKRAIERHRMVYEAMGDLMETDIHAAAIEVIEPTT